MTHDFTRFKKLLSFLNTIVLIFFRITVAVAVLALLAALVVSFLPGDMFQVETGNSFWLSMDNILWQEYETGPDYNVKPVVLAILLILAVALVPTALILLQLNGLLATVRKAQPFAPENARRIQVMGIVTIISSLLLNSARSAIAYVAFTPLAMDNVRIELISVNFTTLFFGVLLLILAEVFRYGSFLQQEYDTTV